MLTSRGLVEFANFSTRRDINHEVESWRLDHNFSRSCAQRHRVEMNLC
jgi:hypothetical protein